MSDPSFENYCEEVDAALFTGDMLHFSKDNRILFARYLERWKRQLAAAEQFAAEEDVL